MNLLSSVQPAVPGVVAVAGGAIMDLAYEVKRMPEQDESLDALSLSFKSGGKGSNIAVAISRGQRDKPKVPRDQIEGAASNLEQKDENEQEVKVFLNRAVGRDHFGEILMKSLKENGVDTSGIKVLDQSQTGTCAVFVEKSSRNCRDIGFPGANPHWAPERRDSVECLADGNKPDLIVTCLENSRTVVEDVLATAHENGVETLLNPSPAYPLLDATYKNVTHLLLNEVEVAKLAGVPKDLPTEGAMLEACTYFMERGVKHVVITLGTRGAFYATDGAHGLVNAVSVPDEDIRDTTGAGETFTGTYALECVRQKRRNQTWDIRKAVEMGCRAAARTILQLGAQDAIPWADEIEAEVDGSKT